MISHPIQPNYHGKRSFLSVFRESKDFPWAVRCHDNSGETTKLIEKRKKGQTVRKQN